MLQKFCIHNDTMHNKIKTGCDRPVLANGPIWLKPYLIGQKSNINSCFGIYRVGIISFPYADLSV